MISGQRAARIRVAASLRSALSGRVRGIVHTRLRKNSCGKSNAYACTSWGMDKVTAPVSAGDVSTRMASGNEVRSCSGRWIRSQYFDTGLKQSLTEMSCEDV